MARFKPCSGALPERVLREFGAGRLWQHGLSGLDTMIALCQIRATTPLEDEGSMGETGLLCASVSLW